MDGYVKIGTELDTKTFEKQIEDVERELDLLETTLSKKKELKLSSEEIEKYEIEVEKLSNKLVDLRKKQAELDKNNFPNLTNGMTNIVKKVGKWSLAIFGIRSAYMGIRNAINTISQDDEQLAADIDYMKTALAYVLEPVIRRIVEWAKQLVFYIGYLIKAWTGHDIFASANKNLKKAAGSAKELNKQLAGFDEMNVMSDNGGGTGGTTMPSFDPETMQTPGWLLWLGENKDIILPLLAGIAAGLIAIKLGAGGILALGIGVAIALLIPMIKDVMDFIKDPSWENFIVVLNDLSLVLGAVAIAMIAFNATNPIGWILLAIAAVGTLTSVIMKNWDKIKDTMAKAIDWIVTLFKNIGTKVGDAVGGAFKAVVNGVLKAIENILNFPIKQVNKLLDVINAVPGINIKKLSTFSLPRLAKGGIVNMPGRGVPIGGAIAGEAGREAVLPLQDSQVLSEIADAIGRRITINANIVNTMNGRVISKELQRVQNDSDFAFNR